MKKISATTICAVALLAMAVCANAQGYSVDIGITTDSGTEFVLDNGAVTVTYYVTITNLGNGAIPQPQVTLTGNDGEVLETLADFQILNNGEYSFTFGVTYDEAGDYDFGVLFQNMTGNGPNFTLDPVVVTVTIVDPPASLPEGFELTDEGLSITLGDFAPPSMNQTVSVWLGCTELKSGPDYRTSRNDLVIKTLQTGTYWIFDSATEYYLIFDLTIDGSGNVFIEDYEEGYYAW